MKAFESVNYEIQTFVGEPFLAAIRHPEKPINISWAFLEAIYNKDVTVIESVKLWDIHTHPEYRKQGYATKLLSLLKRTHDYIETNYTNLKTPGDRLCIKNGFVRRANGYKNQEKVLFWQNPYKNLD